MSEIEANLDIPMLWFCVLLVLLLLLKFYTIWMQNNTIYKVSLAPVEAHQQDERDCRRELFV